MISPTFSNLLLATEGTEFDAGAERVSLALASVQAVPLGVVFPLASNPEYEAVAPQAAARAEREVAISLAKLDDLAKKVGVSLNVKVRRGAERDQEIMEEAAQSKADLLILRRRGKTSFLSRLLIGEMVGRILDRSPCNVLVVPRRCALWQRGIMVVVEEHETDAARALTAMGTAIAKNAQLPLSILIVSSGVETAMHTSSNSPDAALADAGIKIRKERVTDDRVLNYLRAAVADSVDLLVIQLGASGTASGTRLREVIAACEVPVLALRPLTGATNATT